MKTYCELCMDSGIGLEVSNYAGKWICEECYESDSKPLQTKTLTENKPMTINMKITEIEYGRDFKIAPYVNERITIKATYPESENVDLDVALAELKLKVFENSSLSKPIETPMIHHDGTRKVSKNGTITETKLNQDEYL